MSDRVFLGALTVLLCAAPLAIIQACTDRQAAKTGYDVQSRACLVAYDVPAKQRECVEYVRNRWTEAGAPPAAVLDGGSHE